MTYEELQQSIIKQEEEIKRISDEIDILTKKNEELTNNTTLELKGLGEGILALTERFNKEDSIDFSIMQWNVITGTTDATTGTEKSFLHYLPKTPKWIFILPTNSTTQPVGLNNVALCGIYESKESDNSYIYLKATSPSVTFKALCLV